MLQQGPAFTTTSRIRAHAKMWKAPGLTKGDTSNGWVERDGEDEEDEALTEDPIKASTRLAAVSRRRSPLRSSGAAGK